MRTDFLGLFATLNSACAPYVVGGLALLLHGVDRMTADVDLVTDLATGATRDQWRTQRSMEVFSLWDTTNRGLTLDVLLSSPVPFTDLHRDALTVILDGVPVTLASVAHLITMKEHTARPRDLEDVQRLRVLQSGVPK
jgi:hypothetical protein